MDRDKTRGDLLRFALNLGPPPPDAHKEEAPVMKKLRCPVFKSMAHELKGPSQKKKGESDKPESMEEDAGQEDDDGEQNERYAQGMAGAVDGILMAGRVLRNPLLAASSAQHGRDHTPIGVIVEIQKRDESCWEYASPSPQRFAPKFILF
jgi:hypothetical protein